MPGLVPGIHVLNDVRKDVDGRDKPGYDAYARYRGIEIAHNAHRRCRT
jgi:hypothetical protein